MLDVTDVDSIRRGRHSARGSPAGQPGWSTTPASPWAGLELLPLNAIRRQFVNVFGQIAVTQAVLPLLRSLGGGRRDEFHHAAWLRHIGPYAASKHA